MMQPHFCHSLFLQFYQDRTCNTSEWNLGLSKLISSKKSFGYFKSQDTVDLILRTSLRCSSSQSFQLHSEVQVLPSLKLSCQWASSSWEGGIDCFLTHLPSPSLLDACLLLMQSMGVEEQRELENSALWAWPAFKAIMSSSESSHSWRSLTAVLLFGVTWSPPAQLPTHFLPQPWEHWGGPPPDSVCWGALIDASPSPTAPHHTPYLCVSEPISDIWHSQIFYLDKFWEAMCISSSAHF